MNIKLFKQILLITLFLWICSCKIDQQPNSHRFSRQINRAIENNFNYKNAFFYQIDYKRNIFLLWYYDKSMVYWFRYKNNKSLNKGTFESKNNADSLNILQTNAKLKDDLDIFQKGDNCESVLDGEAFGYVLNIANQEFVGLNFISSPECVAKNESKFIANDFKKIRDLNYSFGKQKTDLSPMNMQPQQNQH